MKEKEIQELCEQNGVHVRSVERLPILVHPVYKIKSEETYFLKILDSCVGYKLASLYPVLADKGLPVPEVVFSEEVSGKFAILLRSVSGEALVDCEDNLSQEDTLRIYEHLGSIVASIHSVSFDRFGETKDGLTVDEYSELAKGPFSTWLEMHKEIIEHRLKNLIDSPLEEFIEPIREFFRNNQKLIDTQITPRLLHEDLNKKNIFVQSGRVVGLIDFDGCFVGHREEDLMRTKSAHFPEGGILEEAFYRGYQQKLALSKDFEKRTPYYWLSRYLVHIECLLNYSENYVQDVDFEIDKVKTTLRQFLEC